MNVTLIAPLGVTQADLGNGTKVSVSNTNTVTVDSQHVAHLLNQGFSAPALAGLILDSNGNLIAHVNHRTGTLAALLQLAGGDGEIGVATDVDAFVRFNGVVGQAKAFFANEIESYEYVDSQTAGATTLSTSSTTWTGLLLDNVVSGRLSNPGIYSGTPGIFTLPPQLPITGGVIYRIEVSGRFQFSANATGTTRKLRIETLQGAGAWGIASVFQSANSFVNLANGEVITTGVVEGHCTLDGIFDPSIYPTSLQFRIAAAQDSGAAITCKAVMGAPLKISIKRY